VDTGVVKICAINGYRVASDGETFTVSNNVTQHAFCHKSYIPRDLGAGLDGSVSVNGWCSDLVTKDTYRGIGANVSNGDSFEITNTTSEVAVNGTLECYKGTWKIGSGSMTFGYESRSDRTFCVPHGAKTAEKSITFELWGAQGANTTYKGGKGGYTKGVLESENYNDGNKYYVVVGGVGKTATEGSAGGYNGGGSGSCSNSSAKQGNGGGGATHVATASGLLSSLSGNKSAVLLVAGGGGGEAYDGHKIGSGAGGGGNNSSGDSGYGVHGGNGGSSKDRYEGSVSGQVAGITVMCSKGKNSTRTNMCNSERGVHWTGSHGTFGQGGNGNYDSKSDTEYCGGGGGGGYYGGGGASATGDEDNRSNGGGGSGYCDTSKFTCDGSGLGFNATHEGDGEVKITW
ncbi:MAG: hypothetical protein J6C50_04155, partial [Rickettsiales bacterium]|nr:hypothetical protein [Rickettsiales bacterium]